MLGGRPGSGTTWGMRIGAARAGPAIVLESALSKQPDRRSSLAIGLDLASRVTTIGLEFALPAAAGYGLDSWLGTMPAATVAGVVLGFLAGMYHAVRMASRMPGGPVPPVPRRGERESSPGPRRP